MIKTSLIETHASTHTISIQNYKVLLHIIYDQLQVELNCETCGRRRLYHTKKLYQVNDSLCWFVSKWWRANYTF